MRLLRLATFLLLGSATFCLSSCATAGIFKAGDYTGLIGVVIVVAVLVIVVRRMGGGGGTKH